MPEATGRRFTLDDIIAEEVRKQVAGKAVGGAGGGHDPWGLGGLGIKNIGDITSLLKEINALAQTFQNRSGPPMQKPVRYVQDNTARISKDAAPEDNPPALPSPSSSLDLGRLVDNFIAYMPLFIQTYGDLKLSEVEPMLKEHRDEIITALEAVL